MATAFASSSNHDQYWMASLCSMPGGLNRVPVPERTFPVCFMAVALSPSDFVSVPDAHKNPFLSEMVLRRDGMQWAFLPFYLKRTPALRAIALTTTPAALRLIPWDEQTQEDVQTALPLDGLVLEWTAPRFRTLANCSLAVAQNPDALAFVPLGALMTQVAPIALQKDGRALRHIPSDHQTPSQQLLAVTTTGEALEIIHRSYWTPVLLETAIAHGKGVLGLIPVRERTGPQCCLAVKVDPLSLQWVPSKFRCAQIHWDAVSGDALAYTFVYPSARTLKLSRLAVGKDPALKGLVPDKWKAKC